MKHPLDNLNEALTYHLEFLYEGEKTLQRRLFTFLPMVSTPALAQVWSRYCEQSVDKRLKLKRAFSYLLTGPFQRKNKGMDEVLNDLKGLTKVAEGPLRDVLLCASLRQVIHLQWAGYRAAADLAAGQELHTVADLMEEVAQWEKEADRKLNGLMVNELRPSLLQPEQAMA